MVAGVATVDSLDAMITELDATYVDPLDALISELDRIEAHESMLQDAVAHNKPVVVHPRKEVMVPQSPHVCTFAGLQRCQGSNSRLTRDPLHHEAKIQVIAEVV